MTKWTKTRDFEGRLLTEEWERSDGKWRVGSNINTRDKLLAYWVAEGVPLGNFIGTAKFRKRFGTPDAAMAAVDRRCPVQPE